MSRYESDVALLIEAYHPDLDRLLAILAPHLGESDTAATRQLVLEIGQRIARFRQGWGPS